MSLSTLNWTGWAIALVAGILTIVQWITSRRVRRAQDRAFNILNQQLDADDAREKAEDARVEAARYQQRRLDLRRQIEREIPGEARRAYLKNRLDGLAKGIADDFREYSKIEGELQERSSNIDPSIRSVIENALLPQRKSQHVRERALLGLIVFLALSSLTPINHLGNVYSNVVSEPARYSSGQLTLALLLATFFWLVVARIVLATTRIGAVFRERGARRTAIMAMAVIIFVPLAGSVCNLWVNLHDSPPFSDRSYTYVYGTSYYYLYWMLTACSIIAGVLLAGISLRISQRFRDSTLMRVSHRSADHGSGVDAN